MEFLSQPQTWWFVLGLFLAYTYGFHRGKRFEQKTGAPTDSADALRGILTKFPEAFSGSLMEAAAEMRTAASALERSAGVFVGKRPSLPIETDGPTH